MIDLTRRKLIRNLGLCTILMATGNVRQGLSYISPLLDQNHSLIVPESHAIRICFMGTGETGLEIGIALSKGLYRLPGDTVNHGQNCPVNNCIDIFQFDCHQKKITSLLEQCDLIFLVGSLKDKEFRLARNLMLSTGAKLVININPYEPDINIGKASTIPVSNESFIIVDKTAFKLTALNVVRDICSLLLLPTLICIDFADIREALSGSYGNAGYVEGTIVSGIDRFRKFILRNKQVIMNADAFCLSIAVDYRTDPTLDYLTRISDELYVNCKDDAAFMWSCSNVQSLDTEFRATLLSVQLNEPLG
jgi:hypothetical protein